MKFGAVLVLLTREDGMIPSGGGGRGAFRMHVARAQQANV